MRLLPTVVTGFALSFLTALLIGYFIAMAFPLGHGSLEFYAAEFAGVLVSMAVFYLAVRKSYRRHKDRDSRYAEHWA